MKKIILLLAISLIIGSFGRLGNSRPETVVDTAEIQNEYLIQRGDRLSVEILEHPEFSKEIQVLPDGSIEYPILGKITIEGMTISLLKSVIVENLKPYIPTPIVSIYVISIYGEKINIIGYVHKPGRYQIYKPIDIIDAIALAGGMINVRQVKNVKIIRKNGFVININLSNIWFSKKSNQYSKERIMIYAGDNIIVPPPRSINWSAIGVLITAINLVVTVYSLNP